MDDLFEAVDAVNAANFGYIAVAADVVEVVVVVDPVVSSDADVVNMEDDGFQCYQWNRLVMFVVVYALR